MSKASGATTGIVNAVYAKEALSSPSLSEKLIKINPLTFKRWNDILLDTPGHSFFHTANWARVLCEVYGYSPFYYAIFQRNKLMFLLPLMHVSSRITGNRAVCLPFSDYCFPIMDENIDHKDIPQQIIDEGKKSDWRYIEIRGGRLVPTRILPSSVYYRHLLSLEAGENEVYSRFKKNYRNQIRKAEKSGVRVNMHRSPEAIEDYYRLHCITRKRHGLPPQPINFFRKIYEHIISRNLGFVVLASFRSKPIAGAVYFHFSNQIIYKFAASEVDYQSLYANYLVLWQAIQWAVRNRYQEFCFGKTDAKQGGLIRFKDGWGSSKKELNYYRYDLKTGIFIQDKKTSQGRGYFVLRQMPLPMLRMLGNLLYRHIG